MNPQIFIGSSSEGLHTAYLVKQALGNDFDVTVWNEGIAQHNRDVLTILSKSLVRYDFGIFVATADDLVDYRGDLDFAIRDNVLFEFGLFMGAMGRDYSFLICNHKARLPTDLNGLVIKKFDENAPVGEFNNLNTIVDDLAAHIRQQHQQVRLSTLPSAMFACEYFFNTVLPLVQAVNEKIIQLDGNRLQGDIKLNILVSDSINDHKPDAITALIAGKRSWKKAVMEFNNRFKVAYLDVLSSTMSETIPQYYLIPDSPSILESSVNMLLPPEHFGSNMQQEKVIQREMSSFHRVLSHYINQNKACRNMVSVIPMPQ
ncbi:MAG: nucleotide-binding protein [Bacteroidia bacterium]|jgi:hypothetical protein|nr:nucleotide-binding protein [Bacteroidia bacterium]